MNKQVTATTIDNPFNPFDDFDSWFMFDVEKGYYTSSKLARLTHLTDDMTEKEENEEVERAVDRLIEIDPLDIYIKVTRET
jgi:DNA-binding SARP family transcriptional activator